MHMMRWCWCRWYFEYKHNLYTTRHHFVNTALQFTKYEKCATFAAPQPHQVHHQATPGTAPLIHSSPAFTSSTAFHSIHSVKSAFHLIHCFIAAFHPHSLCLVHPPISFHCLFTPFTAGPNQSCPPVLYGPGNPNLQRPALMPGCHYGEIDDMATFGTFRGHWGNDATMCFL